MEQTGLVRYLAYLVILVLSTNTGAVNAACSYLPEMNKYIDGSIMHLSFEKIPAINVSSYVVGFRFNESITQIQVYGERSVLKANDQLWFIYANQQNLITSIKFDINVLYKKPTSVEEVSFNGKIVCISKDGRLVNLPREDGEPQISSNGKEIAMSLNTEFYVTVLIPPLILAILVILLIVYIKKNEKMKNKKWSNGDPTINFA